MMKHWKLASSLNCVFSVTNSGLFNHLVITFEHSYHVHFWLSFFQSFLLSEANLSKKFDTEFGLTFIQIPTVVTIEYRNFPALWQKQQVTFVTTDAER